MRKNFGAKPYTYPQPVFIVAAYGPDGTPDAMNALLAPADWAYHTVQVFLTVVFGRPLR